MGKTLRMIIGAFCLVVIGVAATNIAQAPHDVAFPASPDLSAILAYLQSVLLNPTPSDRLALLEIAAAAAVLVMTTISENAQRAVPLGYLVSSAQSFVTEMIPVIDSLERKLGKAMPLKAQLQEMQLRLAAIESRDGGLRSLYRDADDIASDVKERLEKLESDEDDNDIKQMVDELGDSVKDYGRRLDDVERVAANLSMVRTSVDALLARVQSLSDPKSGVVANIRFINDAVEPLEGDNGTIAAMLKGDPRYEADLAAQVDELQGSVTKLIATLDAISRSAELAQRTKTQLAQVLSVAGH